MRKQNKGKLITPYEITSVCRADVMEALGLSEKKALAIDDAEMREIARKLADAYCGQGFWIDLPIVAEHVLDIE